MINHLIGAQQSNYPWGFENRLISAIKSLGHTLISTDFRQQRDQLPKLLQQKADLVLVCKGENIDPHLIESCKCVTALWYAEQLGTIDQFDETALGRRKELEYNIHSFDYVYSHDPSNISIYKSLGAEKVFPLPCAAVDPDINQKLNIPKKYDVVFVGSKTSRRQNILNALEKRGIKVFNPNIWDAKELNKLFNESRIVLNLHLSDLPNTETRVAEVLGSGSFLLSENLSDHDLIQNGKHFSSVEISNISQLADKIIYYLANDNEREAIAYQGHQHIHKNHTYAHRINQIINTIDFSAVRRIWPSYVLGVPLNKHMKPTLRLDRFNAYIAESLEGVYKLGSDFKSQKVDNKKLNIDSNSTILDITFKYADSIIPHSDWSIAKNALQLIIENIGKEITGIVEFGAGYSTLFFARYMELNKKSIPIYSFEHNADFFNKLKKYLQPYPFVNLLTPKLKQISDREYEELFNIEHPSSSYVHMGNYVPIEQYHYTRLHNTFYDTNLNQLNFDNVNLVILDGPNGNGRSIAFPLLKDAIKLPFYCLVDDFTHYPFLNEMKRCFDYTKIFEFDYGHNAYSFMKVTNKAK
jgi:hypothetical protein